MSVRSLLGLLLLFTASVLPASAQTVLPESFGAWTASSAPAQTPAAQIGQLAGDKAGVLREYGISSAERREYAQGSRSATVTLYRMVDPTAAYGWFTFSREPRMNPVLSGAGIAYAAASPERAVLVIGNLVLDVSSGATEASAGPASTSKARPSDADLKALAASVLGRSDRRPFPHIPGYLPQTGLIAGSERYVLGPQALGQVFPLSGAPADWIGFDKSAEAVVARYHLNGQPKGQEAVLILALYPTQQIASDKYDALTKWFALNGDPDQANGKPVVFGTRTSALIALLSGVDSRTVASDFLKQIRYVSDVTWNEPTHEFTEPSIGTMIVGAFLGTGFIMVLAIAAGIGFGGIRLLVKLVFPGKVFDRNDRVEILQLGLSSKPIRAGDFYSLK